MKPAHIRRYIGLPVIVQLRDAMALGSVPGPMQAAPVCNAQGELLLKDGSVAPKTAKEEELAYRPAWPIVVRRDADQSPEFRFAIEHAMVSMLEPERRELQKTEEGEFVLQEMGGDLVQIHYRDDNTLYELVVEPEAIVGITCVRQGPMPEEKSRLVHPGRN